MEKYNLLDHFHYDRNDPGKPQIVYFDADPGFHDLLMGTMEEATTEFQESGNHDMSAYLCSMTAAISTKIGPLSMGQMLYVAHSIGFQIGFGQGLAEGVERGKRMVLDLMNSAKPVSLEPKTGWNKTSGNA